MSYESNTGLGVTNHYGPRQTGNTTGVVGTEGREVELSIDINPDVVTNGGPLLVDFKIPKGAVINAAYVDITEAFVLGGTAPTILVGTDASEVTNGLVVSEAQAEAVGTYNVTSTLVGTWDAEVPLAAQTTVGVVLGGTSPTVTSVGKGKVLIKYTTVS